MVMMVVYVVNLFFVPTGIHGAWRRIESTCPRPLNSRRYPKCRFLTPNYKYFHAFQSKKKALALWMIMTAEYLIAASGSL